MVARNKLHPNKNGNGQFWKHIFALAPAVSEHCEHCNTKTHIAGPMYGGPIQSPEFIKKILAGLSEVSKDTYQTCERIEGMLSTALEETLEPLEQDTESPTLSSKTGRYDPAKIDHYPFFFVPSTLAKVLHCLTPHENAIRGALKHLGYRSTRSHTKGGTIRTDAPWSVIWEIMREWVRQEAPIKDGAVKKETVGYRILNHGKSEEPATNNTEVSEKMKIEVIFDEKAGREVGAKKIVRYQLNPRENWGPMNRAKKA